MLPALSLLGLLALACGEDPGAPGAGGDPGLRCEAPLVELGEVWQGVVLEHEFELTTIEEGVVVAAVRADCGCTVAQLQRVVGEGTGARETIEGAPPLARGTRLVLGVRYDTHGKRGHAPRTVSVHTASGQLDLTLEATVRPWVEVEPPQLDLPLVAEDEAQEARFRLTSATGGRFHVRPTGRGVPDTVRIVATPVEPGERAAAWEVVATLGPGLPQGVRGYPIELQITPEEPEAWSTEEDGTLRVTPMVSVRVVGQVSLYPPSVAFGRLVPGETVARTVRLQGHDPDHPLGEPKVHVEGLRPEEDAALPEVATVTTTPVPGENAWDVQVLLRDYAGRFEGTVLGRLVVATGHPDQPRVEATLSAFLPLPPGRTPARPPAAPGG